MKIAIYDTQHYEMVNVLFRIFNSNENEIIFLVNTGIKEKLIAASGSELKKHFFVIEELHESPASFFTRCEEALKKFNPDFLILNTIDKDYRDIWNFLKNVTFPYFITIHNINTWLNPPFTLNRIALKNYYYRKKIVKKSSMIAVQEELFVPYITHKKLYKKPIITIPHTLREEDPVHPVNPKIVISIPGGIDGVRRDNDLSLDVIEEVNKHSERFQFVFIGKVLGHLGEKIQDRMLSLQKKGLDIQHFYDDNSNKVFDEHMKRCDIIFLPLNVNTKYEGIPEIYGTTKVTGVIYDMMRFCKPGIVPAKMVVPPTMNSSMLSYSGKEELIKMILSLEKEENKIMGLKKEAEKNSLYYTRDEIRKRVLPLVEKTLLQQ